MDSIDIFDTALFRDVYEPTDLFNIIESKVGKNFAYRRVEAENLACKKNRFYSIDDIYKNLPGLYPNEEVNTEFEHCYANPVILEMYNKNPNNYIFISDMYLDSKTLCRLLSKCGYKNPRVFVSCEEKCIKGTGELFKKIERRVGKINTHYGDNYSADIMGAHKVNINTVYSPALHKLNIQLPSTNNSLLKKYSALLHKSEEPTVVKLCKWYAPLIYEFTKWVIRNRKEGQSIFFLARDMYLPYMIAKDILKAEDVHYLYCSRRSLAPMFIQSKEAPFIEKMKSILTEDEYNYKKSVGIDECMKYLNSMNIKNGDMLVDIGYSGSTQRLIEKYFHISLDGRYMQLDSVPEQHKSMQLTQFLNRPVLYYRFLAEFVLSSNEDCVEDYKNGKVIFTPDNEKRKEYAKIMSKEVLNEKLLHKIDNMELSLFDVEQLIIHLQHNMSEDIINLFNEPILTNRKKIERGVNFDRNRILKGELIDCYNESYAKPLFKELLKKDKELSQLVSLLPS